MIERSKRQGESQPPQQGDRNETPIMEAKGYNGQLQLFADRVTIRRKGFRALMTIGPMKGDKDILLSQIGSVEFKPAGMFINGYIRFAFMGGLERRERILTVAKDENALVFGRGQQPEFERLNAAIRERMAAQREGNERKAPSNLDDLEKLSALRDKGVITEDEFQQKKKQILGL